MPEIWTLGPKKMIAVGLKIHELNNRNTLFKTQTVIYRYIINSGTLSTEFVILHCVMNNASKNIQKSLFSSFLPSKSILRPQSGEEVYTEAQ